MRRLLILAVGFGLVAGACTSSLDITTTAATSQPYATTIPPTTTTTTVSMGTTTSTEPPDGFGGEVTIGVDFPIETLNPFAPKAFSSRLVGNAVWAMVYDIDPVTWARVPDAVVNLPSQSDGIAVNDDGTMTVRYDVVQEAVWSDGEPITGHDVAFTAEALKDMAVDATAEVDEVMSMVIATESEGKTAFITFEEPTLAFEDALWIILPSHLLEGVDLVNGTDGSEWPSGGPFVVDEWEPFDSVRFVRNANYWKIDDTGRSLPYLDALTVLATTEPGLQGDEPASPVGAFLRREIDIADGLWDQVDIDRIEATETDHAIVQRVPIPVLEQLTFNFSDARFDVNPDSVNAFIDYRRALASSIDRAQLLDETGVPWFPETPGMLIPRGISAWSKHEVGIAKVRELRDGAASLVSFASPGDYRLWVGDALESAFMAVDVRYETDNQELSVFFGATIDEGAFDIGMWAWVSDGGFTNQLWLLNLLDPRSSPSEEGFRGGGNYGRWGDGTSPHDNTTRFSELVDEAEATVDAARFNEIVLEAESILATELPMIPLFLKSVAAAVWVDAVTGVIPNGSASDFTWNIESWQRVGE